MHKRILKVKTYIAYSILAILKNRWRFNMVEHLVKKLFIHQLNWNIQICTLFWRLLVIERFVQAFAQKIVYAFKLVTFVSFGLKFAHWCDSVCWIIQFLGCFLQIMDLIHVFFFCCVNFLGFFWYEVEVVLFLFSRLFTFS